MKKILFLLSKNDSMTRNDIVYAIEKEQWNRITKTSSAHGERLLIDKVRVSYDRTLKRLTDLGFVEGGFPAGLGRLSPYRGTLWRGYLYTITPKGRMQTQEIIRKTLKPLEEYSSTLIDSL